MSSQPWSKWPRSSDFRIAIISASRGEPLLDIPTEPGATTRAARRRSLALRDIIRPNNGCFNSIFPPLTEAGSGPGWIRRARARRRLRVVAPPTSWPDFCRIRPFRVARATDGTMYVDTRRRSDRRDHAIGTADHTPYSGFVGRDRTAARKNINSPGCLTRAFLMVRRPRVLPIEDFVATPKASRQDLIQYLAVGAILLGGLAWASRPAPGSTRPCPIPGRGRRWRRSSPTPGTTS